VFHPFIPTQQIQALRSVEMDFPFRPAAFDDEKASLLVDGQQRTAALAMVSVDEHPEVMLSAIALVADGDEAKKIFQVANSTHKTTTEFSRALLASMEYEGGYLRTEQIKARACKLLAIDHDSSPFKGLVRYPGVPRVPTQIIAYNSIFQVVSKFAESGLPEIEENSELLSNMVEKYFEIVKATWPEAWGNKPSESRLMHGAGLRSMAALGEELLRSAYRLFSAMSDEAWKDIGGSVQRLRPTVLWDSSALDGNASQRKSYTQEIIVAQNTNQSITSLTNFLVKESLAADKRAKEKR
jgi:DGQHR domain-containing protein